MKLFAVAINSYVISILITILAWTKESKQAKLLENSTFHYSISHNWGYFDSLAHANVLINMLINWKDIFFDPLWPDMTTTGLNVWADHRHGAPRWHRSHILCHFSLDDSQNKESPKSEVSESLFPGPNHQEERQTTWDGCSPTHWLSPESSRGRNTVPIPRQIIYFLFKFICNISFSFIF